MPGAGTRTGPCAPTTAAATSARVRGRSIRGVVRWEPDQLRHSIRRDGTVRAWTSSPRQVAELQRRGGVQLIDVREDYEWDAGRIPGARHVELSKLTLRPTLLAPRRARRVRLPRRRALDDGRERVPARRLRRLLAGRRDARLGAARAAVRPAGRHGGRPLMRAVLTLLVLLALAAPAQAAPTLAKLGDFDQPTYATSPPGDPTRVFVTERTGRIRLLVGDKPLAGAVPRPQRHGADRLPGARAALDGVRARLRHVRALLRLPHGHRRGVAVRHRRRDPGARVPPLARRPERRRAHRLPRAAGRPAHRRQEPRRRPAPVRPRRPALRGHGRRRRRQQPVPPLPGRQLAARQAAARRRQRARAGLADRLRRPAQPLALLVRPPDRPDRDRRRRPGPLRGDRRRPGRQLRLAVPGGQHARRQRPGLRRRRHRAAVPHPHALRRRLLLDHRRLRGARPRAADAQRPLPLRRLLQGRPALGQPDGPGQRRRRPASTSASSARSARTPAGGSWSSRSPARSPGWSTARRHPAAPGPAPSPRRRPRTPAPARSRCASPASTACASATT